VDLVLLIVLIFIWFLLQIFSVKYIYFISRRIVVDGNVTNGNCLDNRVSKPNSYFDSSH